MPVARTGSSPPGQGQAQPLLYTEYGVSLHSSNHRLRTDTGRAQRCPIVYSRQGRGKPSPYYIRNIAACAPVPGRAQRFGAVIELVDALNPADTLQPTGTLELAAWQ